LRSELSDGYSLRPLSAIKHIVIHHTGVDVDSTPAEIDAYHRSLGWPSIGYHMVVTKEAAYYVGDVGTKRANVYARNHEVFGIVLTGDFSRYYPLPSQLLWTKKAIAFARDLIPHMVDVVGHREIALPSSPTACPGATWPAWREMVI